MNGMNIELHYQNLLTNSDKMKTVLILLDAFRHDYLSEDNTPFLHSLSKKSIYIKRIIPSYGFCERTEILTGLNSKQSGFFTAIGYDPENSEYKNISVLSLAGFFEKFFSRTSMYKNNSLRSLYRRFIIKYLLKNKNFKMRTYEIPFSLLKYFNLTEDLKDHRDPGAFGSESIFDIIKDLKKECFYDSFTALGFTENGDDNNRLRLAFDNAKNKNFELYLIYNSVPDFLGHKFGVNSNELKIGLKKLDKTISNFTNSFIDLSPNTKFIFLGDHGMTNVLNKINAEVEILNIARIHNLKLERDYIYFLDSTIFRIWLISSKSKKIFKERITNSKLFLNNGNFVDETFAKENCIPYDDHRYGDLIWLANEGVLISPDFFHSNINTSPKGMHGYNPRLKDSQGLSIIYDNIQKNSKVEIFEKKKLTYIFNILKESIKS